MATSIPPEPSAIPLDIHLKSPDLVFVGLNIGWLSRPSDFTMNSSLAELWEDAFPRWEVDGRTLMLREPHTTYTVRLRDGDARFWAGSGPGLDRLLVHSQHLFDALKKGGRSHTAAVIEIQYLTPSTLTFEDLRDRLAAKLLNDHFVPALGGGVVDLAVTLDFLMDGRLYQLNAGPVRASEIPQRVGVPIPKERVPPVAIFFSVNNRWQVADAADGIKLAIQRVLEVAQKVDQEIQK